MRHLVFFTLFVNLLLANDVVDFYKKDPKNQIICQVGKHAYKLLSKNNSELVHVHGHDYIKVKNENLYLSVQGCSPANDEKLGIIF